MVCYSDNSMTKDLFVKMDFIFKHAVASIKVGDGIKAEGELIISGTKGYVYVPAPWWKTEYFEVRYEDQTMNKRYFYQLDGEGIRYELVAFMKAIESGKLFGEVSKKVSLAITSQLEQFEKKKDLIII